ncbi:MAG: right-handed parallel beta-helix repeat-containing protein [Planctomycetes bacterium]|nr:right-handed parallel beta-helix repeat-containing protein [Planctomycetota bacterium]
MEGRGLIDGRAEYEWRENDIEDRYIYPNLVRAREAGRSLRRSFPKPDSVGHLVQFVRCRDVHIRDLKLYRSPSWTMHLWGCDRVWLDGLDIRTSLMDGVWADGVDPDGCSDLHISNCNIETGDDALVFYSTNTFGPARPCEDITVTNCRLTSSSSAIKFCDGNQNCVRRVAIDNCTITNSNRGIAFMVFDGGYVSDVVISNMSIECTRRDWFWWGEGDPIHFNIKRRCEIDPNGNPAKEPPAGSIRNIMIRNVVARGAGTNSIDGHPNSPLENITIDGFSLVVTNDPTAPYPTAGSAFAVKNARNIKLNNVEVSWEAPASAAWKSALELHGVENITIADFSGRQARDSAADSALVFEQVKNARIRHCAAPAGTGNFIYISGDGCRDLRLFDNDLKNAASAWKADIKEIPESILRSANDRLPEK